MILEPLFLVQLINFYTIGTASANSILELCRTIPIGVSGLVFGRSLLCPCEHETVGALAQARWKTFVNGMYQANTISKHNK